MRFNLIILFCLFITAFGRISLAQGISQAEWPEIGKNIPDFTLSNIDDYQASTITSKELMGKFVILDFWNKNCTSCFHAFPKTNELAKIYKGQLELFLVGGENYTRPLYTRFKNRFGLNLPIVYDSALYDRFNFGGSAPLLIWIDNKGIVKAITTSSALSKENIELFIQGRTFPFRDYSYKSYLAKEKYNPAKPFLINENGGDDSTDYIYRSILLKFKESMPFKGTPQCLDDILINTVYDKGLIEGVSGLQHLYNLAFLGCGFWYYTDSLVYNTNYYKPILQISDSSIFKSDVSTAKDVFWYSLKVSDSLANKAHVMKVMQNDLDSYFGYKVMVETRRMPYYRIVLRNANKTKSNLKAKTSTTSWKGDHTFYDGKNLSLAHFLNYLFGLTAAENLFQIADETGIDYNVDIKVENLPAMTFNDYKKILENLGFDILTGEKDFKVLVISDK